jgi:exoribonuclease II
MSEIEKVKETLEQVDSEKVKSDSEQISDVIGTAQNGIEVVASHSQKTYHFVPVSMRNIPKLSKLIADIDEEMKGATNESIMSEAAMMKMAEVISMGMREKLTVDQIMDEFSLGDFPKCFNNVLDLNDFLSGMGNIGKMGMLKKRV